MTANPEFRTIDLETWSRREQYELYRDLTFPYFSVTADVDVTGLRKLVRRLQCSFTVGISYAIAHAANEVPQMRLRMHGEEIREYTVVHPSITILNGSEQFRFCALPYVESFDAFRKTGSERIEAAKNSPTLWIEPDRDDFLFMTSLPWIRFTAMVHPVPMEPACSVPRIAWGKFQEEGGRILMPLNVQAHHAMIDGVHLGRFYEGVQRILDQAEGWSAE